MIWSAAMILFLNSSQVGHRIDLVVRERSRLIKGLRPANIAAGVCCAEGVVMTDLASITKVNCRAWHGAVIDR